MLADGVGCVATARMGIRILYFEIELSTGLRTHDYELLSCILVLYINLVWGGRGYH
ncbi:hypothetical protein M6B38_341900 [Iris pallida]|uniref:Uncharacterized protein n=1 Tax=Iris pallida TaxID=29817 RepID=A0AAX6GWZ5_IRIPA|nr:hypothetical protein M6B38_341900 [Iris pallida]